MEGKINASCMLHRGRVVGLGEGLVRVSIITESACSTCHAKGACGLHEAKERIIAVRADSSPYRPGDLVHVGVRPRQGLWAVLLGYVSPFVLVVGTLATLVSLGHNEGLAAVVALGLLVPYYLALYLLRARIARRFSFSISPISK